MGVAMSADNGVANLARHCARAQVTWPERQRSSRTTGKHDQIHVTLLHRQPGNRPGISPGPRRGALLAAPGSNPGTLHQFLRKPCFGRNIRALAELPEAQAQEGSHNPAPGLTNAGHVTVACRFEA